VSVFSSVHMHITFCIFFRIIESVLFHVFTYPSYIEYSSVLTFISPSETVLSVFFVSSLDRFLLTKNLVFPSPFSKCLHWWFISIVCLSTPLYLLRNLLHLSYESRYGIREGIEIFVAVQAVILRCSFLCVVSI